MIRVSADTALKNREAANRHARESYKSARSIGDIPKIQKPRRRAACKKDLELFCRTYFPARFPLPFSGMHREVLDIMYQVQTRGDCYALAMPRGSGKTTLCEALCLSSALYGFHHFIVLFGSNKSAAVNLIESLKVELESNDLLYEDFPEVCHPIRALVVPASCITARGLGSSGVPRRSASPA